MFKPNFFFEEIWQTVTDIFLIIEVQSARSSVQNSFEVNGDSTLSTEMSITLCNAHTFLI